MHKIKERCAEKGCAGGSGSGRRLLQPQLRCAAGRRSLQLQPQLRLAAVPNACGTPVAARAAWAATCLLRIPAPLDAIWIATAVTA